MDIARLKKELQLNEELMELVEIIRDISIAQYHVLEQQRDKFRRFINEFSAFFQMINFKDTEDRLMMGNPNAAAGIIIVTSDMGFMGGLNSKVIQAAQEKYNSEFKLGKKGNPRLIVVGQKGADYLKDLGFQFTAFPGISLEREENFHKALAIKEYLTKEFLEDRLGSLFLFYPRPLLFVVQQVEMVTLIPISEPLRDKEETALRRGEVILESSFKDMVVYLVGAWLAHFLFQIFEESKLSELAARSVHLEGSFQELKDINKDLRLKHFRLKHELIDKSMREIFSANTLISSH